MTGAARQRRGADALVEVLEQRGVEIIFGLCGHGALSVLDAIADSSIEFVSVHHEQVAVHAADAYYRVSHRPGVVLTTIGPGSINATAAIADAALDASGVLIISGSVPSKYAGLGAYQEIDLHADDSQSLVTRPLTKRDYSIRNVESLPHVISRAWQETVTGCPGPVHVHVPLDLLSSRCDAPSPRSYEVAKPCLSPATVSEIVTMLRRSKRPVIYAGGGTSIADASIPLQELAESGSIPVVTSMIAQGVIPENHPLSLGFAGVVGTEPANQAMRDADLVIAVGTRFPEMDSSSWRPESFFDPSKCELIQIDIDPREIGRIYSPSIGAVADAGMALEQLSAVLKESPIERPAETAQYQNQKRSWLDKLSSSQESGLFPMEPAHVIAKVREAMATDAILVSGAGVRHLVGQHFPVLEPRTLLISSGFSTMGWETAAALGAKAARPESVVVALIGDGALQSTVSALATAVAYDLPIIWIILDNSGYQSIALYQDKHFGRRLGTEFVNRNGEIYHTDYVALAQAYGLTAEKLEHASDFPDALDRAMDKGGHHLIQIPTTGRPVTKTSGEWDVNRIMPGEWDLAPAPYDYGQ